MLQRVLLHSATPLPLWHAQSSRAIERAALATPQHPSLMERAGASIGHLARAVAPHARQAWVLCGPGNNGGDGIVAARHLATQGLTVHVHWFGNPTQCSADTLHAWQQAQHSPIHWLQPNTIPELSSEDIWVDALLGLGQRPASTNPPSPIAALLQHADASNAHTLAVDVPTGLDCSTGTWLEGYAPRNPQTVARRHTLSILTLKTGLFTAHGRDACGHIWWDDLGCTNLLQQHTPDAWLSAIPRTMRRPHNTHKGSFGDVLVIGGATGMTGAAILAASAALHHGAGRTLLHLLDATTKEPTPSLPDLMLPNAASTHALLPHATVVCGCGGGNHIHTWLPAVLSQSPRLVLDADALNAIAYDSRLQEALAKRCKRQQATVLTPHPLEAARLLQCSTTDVQAQRLHAAQTLAKQFHCTVVLKGAGSIIASPDHTPHINPTGNARLAIGGTGDVLAGLLGARWQLESDAHTAAVQAVWEHGAWADQWPCDQPLVASRLAKAQWQK